MALPKGVKYAHLMEEFPDAMLRLTDGHGTGEQGPGARKPQRPPNKMYTDISTKNRRIKRMKVSDATGSRLAYGPPASKTSSLPALVRDNATCATQDGLFIEIMPRIKPIMQFLAPNPWQTRISRTSRRKSSTMNILSPCGTQALAHQAVWRLVMIAKPLEHSEVRRSQANTCTILLAVSATNPITYIPVFVSTSQEA